MKLIVREQADLDLDEIFDWVAKDNPQAAVNVIRRIRDRIELLADSDFGDQGRVGVVPGTREVLVGSHIIVYEPSRDRDEIVVSAIVRTARKR